MATIDINLLGAMRNCYAGIELLVETGGCIVNTALMMSYFGSAMALRARFAEGFSDSVPFGG